MSYLSRQEIENLRPVLDKMVYRVLGSSDDVVRNIVENCLYSGFDRKRTIEKLNDVIDSKKASRMYDKLEDLLEENKNSSKARKRPHEEDERKERDVKKSKPTRNEREPSKPREEEAAAPTAPKEESSLTSQQIKQMMANAQREIEERKRALTALKTKDPSLGADAQSTATVESSQKMQPTNPEDIARAKKIADLQAQIRAKLSGSLSAIIPQVQEKPKPLILDEEGRTVDKAGRAISIPTLAPTLKANIRAKKKEIFNKASQPAERMYEDDTQKFFDDRIAAKSAFRSKRALRFHEPGKFQQMAERMRMKSQLEKLQNEISQIARKTGISSATKLALIAPKQDSHADDVPTMEWWDSVILANDLSTMDGDKIAIRESAISNLIEHPTQMKPPNEPLRPCYMPVFLTKKERKKLRRQNRREAWKEEQEKIRIGLAPPPEPKLRISNLMRVLGSEAVQDPTKIEAHVREQMAKRQKAHEEANNARKLTAEQKREKKVRKMKEDTSCGVHVSVYRIRELYDIQSKKYKVETNAKQLHMTGVVVLFRDCCVVVVEGGPKQQKKYKRLMQTRIKWEEDMVKNADGNEVPNSCTLVWEGTSQRRHFGEVKFKVFPMEKMAREFFQKHQVEHFWDLAYSGAVLEASEDV
ncbi:U4/U6 small nuclear ribonucleoprotein Prp3 [Bradysia coprophila]|uniref:U4/U6 small nuclear ribonucleoprotein Prp3 n=1 Tax=Bradysia coprophila TaxID=38358 RepID=UPI00187D772B|nr:U4/U6 small nuclear ribonucleoprotein Prp3 [Bradysia coprophila]